MKCMLSKHNRIAIALMLAAAVVILSVPALADDADKDLHAGVGSLFLAASEDDDDGLKLGAGVHAVMTATTDPAQDEIITDEKSPVTDALADEEELDTIETDVEDEFADLVMANVEDAVNVREEPSEEAPVAGKLFANCGGKILEQKDGWTRLSSGDLEGWTKDEFLLFGEEAKALYDEVVSMEAKVTTSGLRIRKEQSEDAAILDLAEEGKVLKAVEDLGDWVSVKYDGETGYVSSEFVELSYSVPTGKTTEQIAAEEKAKAEKAKAEKEAKAKKAGKVTTDRGAVASAANDVTLLAALIQCEAGRECYEGQLAVGAVVMNRVRSGSYPSTVSAVINQPSQFPPATNGRVASVLASGPSASCIQAAQAAISGQSNVGGALHFGGGSGGSIVIGNHSFW